jgi:Flp pilus assembly protein CpaB
MSIRSVLIIALGIASGTFAVVGGRLWGPKPSTGPVPEVKTVPVVVVKEPMGLGFTIKPELVEVKQWPVELVPPGAITDVAKAEGRVSLVSLSPGEVLLEAKLAAEGVRRGAGGMVRPGMRAYTILATSAAASVAGLILPGDQVDVIMSLETSPNDPAGGGSSYTLLQNVEILAVNQRLDSPADDRPEAKLSSVTLLVTQQQASLLGLAQRTGNLSLSLRNPEDLSVEEIEPISLAAIKGLHQIGARDADTASKPGQGQRLVVDHSADESVSEGDEDVVISSDGGAEGGVSNREGSADVAEESDGATESVKSVSTNRKLSQSMIRTLRGNQSGSVAITISKL